MGSTLGNIFHGFLSGVFFFSLLPPGGKMQFGIHSWRLYRQWSKYQKPTIVHEKLAFKAA